jgi:hypothetical protein
VRQVASAREIRSAAHGVKQASRKPSDCDMRQNRVNKLYNVRGLLESAIVVRLFARHAGDSLRGWAQSRPTSSGQQLVKKWSMNVCNTLGKTVSMALTIARLEVIWHSMAGDFRLRRQRLPGGRRSQSAQFTPR